MSTDTAQEGFYLADDDTVCYIDAQGREYRPYPYIDLFKAQAWKVVYVQDNDATCYYEVSSLTAALCSNSPGAASPNQETPPMEHNPSYSVTDVAAGKDNAAAQAQAEAQSEPVPSETQSVVEQPVADSPQANDGDGSPGPTSMEKRKGRRGPRHGHKRVSKSTVPKKEKPARKESSPDEMDGATTDTESTTENPDSLSAEEGLTENSKEKGQERGIRKPKGVGCNKKNRKKGEASSERIIPERLSLPNTKDPESLQRSDKSKPPAPGSLPKTNQQQADKRKEKISKRHGSPKRDSSPKRGSSQAATGRPKLLAGAAGEHGEKYKSRRNLLAGENSGERSKSRRNLLAGEGGTSRRNLQAGDRGRSRRNLMVGDKDDSVKRNSLSPLRNLHAGDRGRSRRNLMVEDDGGIEKGDSVSPVRTNGTGTAGCKNCSTRADRINRRNHMRKLKMNTPVGCNLDKEFDCDDDDDAVAEQREMDPREEEEQKEEGSEEEELISGMKKDEERPSGSRKSMFGLKSAKSAGLSAVKKLIGKKVVDISVQVGAGKLATNHAAELSTEVANAAPHQELRLKAALDQQRSIAEKPGESCDDLDDTCDDLPAPIEGPLLAPLLPRSSLRTRKKTLHGPGNITNASMPNTTIQMTRSEMLRGASSRSMRHLQGGNRTLSGSNASSTVDHGDSTSNTASRQRNSQWSTPSTASCTSLRGRGRRGEKEDNPFSSIVNDSISGAASESAAHKTSKRSKHPRHERAVQN